MKSLIIGFIAFVFGTVLSYTQTPTVNSITINNNFINFEYAGYEVIINDEIEIKFEILNNKVVAQTPDGFLIVKSTEYMLDYVLNNYKIKPVDILLIRRDIVGKNSYLLALHYDQYYESYVVDDFTENKYWIEDNEKNYLNRFKTRMKEIIHC